MSPALAAEESCYLTTIGRRSGRPHRIEIWFAAAAGRDTIYLLAGGRDRADWVRNLRARPTVRVEVGRHAFDDVAAFRQAFPARKAAPAARRAAARAR